MEAAKQEIVRPFDDHYPTDPEPVRALLSVESFSGGVWECAAGDGAMAATLREAGHTVRATTMYEGRHDRDFPKHKVVGGVDFLAETETKHPNIVTNPPYGKLNGKTDRKAAEKFIRHALSLNPHKVAMLLPMQFWGGQDRMNGLHKELRPSRIWQFADRIKFYPAGIDKTDLNTPAHYFGWFVWDLPLSGAWPSIGLLNSKDFTIPALPNR
ncbi:MAG: hypothetical protein ACNI26_13155 [Terasakiella sp.]|uniref:hypothetical protein n=1 Tax=unclassified Terasakiella TaxID=2614952 RepID=UPI003B008679